MFLVEHLITLIKQFKDKKKKVDYYFEAILYCMIISEYTFKKTLMSIIYLSGFDSDC